MYETVDGYKRSFLNPQGNEIDEKYLETRNCPCCNAQNEREILRKNGGRYVACNNCTMIFLNPVFTDKELYLYYKNNNVAQSEAHETEINFYRNIYISGLKSISSVFSARTILDIGCSSGLFLNVAKESKMETFGVEINSIESGIARNNGHKILGGTIEDIDDKQKFDVISMWDVFEHIKDGKLYLERLRNFLSEDGVVFLQIPNVNSLAARVLRVSCNMFDGLEHVNLYSSHTISQVASAAGFDIISMNSIIDELAPIGNYLNYEDPYFGSFVPDRHLKFLTPELIHENLLGYKLQVVMRPT